MTLGCPLPSPIAPAPPVQFLRDDGGRPLPNTMLDGIPLVGHYPVDAEVQVGAIKLEQIPEQVLKLGQVRLRGS